MTVVTPTEKKIVELDDILVKFSLFGKYHRQCFLMIFFVFMSNSLYCNNFVFVAEEVGYRCKNPSFDNINNTCTDPNNSSHRCTEWEYDNPHSFVAEYDLACQEWKRTLVGTAHSMGYMVGLLLVGPLSDRLGRKKLIIITGVLGSTIGVTRSFSPCYWLYIALEFLEAAVGDPCSPMFMMTVEIVANNKRLLYQMMTSIAFSIGGMTLALVAWLAVYWRYYLRIIYAPASLFFLYLFLLDESPRWLLSKGRKDEAITILEKISKKNKVKIEKIVLEKLKCEEEERGATLPELLKSTFASAALLKRFFICLTWWITSTFVNYGMAINSVSLQGNKYMNYALMSMVEFPGNILMTLLMLRFKRKIPLIFSFVATACLLLSQPFVPKDLPWLSILLYLMGKFMSAGFFTITYIFTSELFPTYTRNSMHALCSSLGRIGSIVAPQTPLLMHYWAGLPAFVFGAASLFAGIVTFFVPDTADTSLPDTVTQAEQLGKSKKKLPEKEEKNIFVIPYQRTISRL